MNDNAHPELPDVNVLVAMSINTHLHYDAAIAWFNNADTFALCPFTEAGLVRNLMNPAIPGCGLNATEAFGVLADIAAAPGYEFWPDGMSLLAGSIPPKSLLGYRQVTDYYLLNLAIRNQAVLVTFDSKIAASVPAKYQKHLRILTIPNQPSGN